MEHHLTAMECHLPYGITQCYLLTDTSEHTPPSPQPDRPVLDLPTLEGWKAELTPRAGLRHVRSVRPNRATDLRGPSFWMLKKLCRPIWTTLMF